MDNEKKFEYKIEGEDVWMKSQWPIVNQPDTKNFEQFTEVIKSQLGKNTLTRNPNATPEPLSEQKQEGEMVEHPNLTASKEATKRINEEYSASSHPFKYGYKAGFTDACEWQSQHAAKQIQETKDELSSASELCNQYGYELKEKDNQIDQYKARIGELEDALETTQGLLTNIRHETDYMPDSYYQWIDGVLNKTNIIPTKE